MRIVNLNLLRGANSVDSSPSGPAGFCEGPVVAGLWAVETQVQVPSSESIPAVFVRYISDESCKGISVTNAS